MNNKVIRIFEISVIVAILLVLIQTFLEDFAVVVGWNINVRNSLSVSGFLFDLFFTIEFLSRLYYAIINNRVKKYLFQERGWIDFLASIPLLMFNSGPTVLALLSQGTIFAGLGGILNVSKVIKAIRIL